MLGLGLLQRLQPQFQRVSRKGWRSCGRPFRFGCRNCKISSWHGFDQFEEAGKKGEMLESTGGEGFSGGWQKKFFKELNLAGFLQVL